MMLKVRDFFEQGRESLQLELEAGEPWLDRPLREAALHRPGLALAGFFKYCASNRMQVIGLAEHSFLHDLSAVDRTQRLRQLFARGIPCLVVTRGRHAGPDLRDAAVEFQIPLMRSRLHTGRFMNMAAVLIESMTAPHERVHGTMVDILGVGVLIEGDPGIGKSETALSLIERGHSLVADDVTVLRRDHGVVHGSAVEITRFHMEIRGLGIIHVPSLFGVAAVRGETRLDLVVRLQRQDESHEADRSGLIAQWRTLLGVAVPQVTLPVAPGRDLAHVIEVAALNQRLKNLGHDAAKELNDRLTSMLARKGGGRAGA